MTDNQTKEWRKCTICHKRIGWLFCKVCTKRVDRQVDQDVKKWGFTNWEEFWYLLPDDDTYYYSQELLRRLEAKYGR